MKRKELVAELKSLGLADLKARASKISEELMKLRFRKSTGQNEGAARSVELRKELARVLTVSNAKRQAQGS